MSYFLLLVSILLVPDATDIICLNYSFLFSGQRLGFLLFSDTIYMWVFSAPYTRNRTWRHYNGNKMCVE